MIYTIVSTIPILDHAPRPRSNLPLILNVDFWIVINTNGENGENGRMRDINLFAIIIIMLSIVIVVAILISMWEPVETAVPIDSLEITPSPGSDLLALFTGVILVISIGAAMVMVMVGSSD